MSIVLIVVGFVVAMAIAYALMICMFWLMLAGIADTVLQSVAKKKDRHAP